ncbi:MAG: hypothetical protein GW857_08485 [Sphingomonadales bacterium]|nr:hypothetical protein [Sphingomonadales bacterium]
MAYSTDREHGNVRWLSKKMRNMASAWAWRATVRHFREIEPFESKLEI